jgi:hypothetical protein
VASCEPAGVVDIALVVWNDGSRKVEPGAYLALFGDDGTGPRPFHEQLLPEVPASGSVQLVVSATTAEVGDVITASIDHSASIEECFEDDNTDAYGDLPCR